MSDTTWYFIGGRQSGKTHETVDWVKGVLADTDETPKVLCGSESRRDELVVRLVDAGLDRGVAAQVPVSASMGFEEARRKLRGVRYWAVDDLDLVLRWVSMQRPGLVTATGATFVNHTNPTRDEVPMGDSEGWPSIYSTERELLELESHQTRRLLQKLRGQERSYGLVVGLLVGRLDQIEAEVSDG